jgi:hypothetical protein
MTGTYVPELSFYGWGGSLVNFLPRAGLERDSSHLFPE